MIQLQHAWIKMHFRRILSKSWYVSRNDSFFSLFGEKQKMHVNFGGENDATGKINKSLFH